MELFVYCLVAVLGVGFLALLIALFVAHVVRRERD